jgi:glutaredoxin
MNRETEFYQEWEEDQEDFGKNKGVGNIVVYGKNVCSYCNRTIELLDELQLEYSYILIETEEEVKELKAKIKEEVNTVPQIFIDNRHIGGYNSLKSILDYML